MLGRVGWLSAALLVGPLLVGCGPAGGGGTGDAPTPPVGDPFGAGSRIHEVIGKATWLDAANTESVGCAVPPDRHVSASGLAVVAIDRYDETADGAIGNVYAQDPEDVPYAGITIFDPGFSPPDLHLAPGDHVDFVGTAMEFLGPSTGRFGGCKTLPELSGALSLRFDGLPPAPAAITLADLTKYEVDDGTDAPPGARKWIGRLVRLADVTISGAPQSSGGRYTASIDVGAGVPFGDVPKISNELFDLEAEGPLLEDQAHFSAVTGVVTYFYGFKLAPRSAADFEP